MPEEVDVTVTLPPRLAAIRALRLMDPKVAEILRFNAEEARIPGGHTGGGRFRRLSDMITEALKGHKEGDKDPLADYSQTQLRTAAKQLGLNPPPRVSREALAEHVRNKVLHGRDIPETPTPAKAAKKATPGRATKASRQTALEDLHAAGGQSSHVDANPATLDALERDGHIRREGHVVHLTDAGRAELAKASAPKKKVAPRKAPAGPAPLSSDPQARAAQVEQAVLDAYQRVRGRHDAGDTEWVSLADLRDELSSDLPRGEVDDALTRLNRTPAARIVPESSQKAMDPRHHAAAVIIGNQRKHLIAIDTPESLRAAAKRERARGGEAYATPLEAKADVIEAADRERSALIASARKATPRAAARTPKVKESPAETVERLDAAKTRDEAREILADKTVAELKAISPTSAGVAQGRADLVEKIVALHVGGRIDFAAVREESLNPDLQAKKPSSPAAKGFSSADFKALARDYRPASRPAQGILQNAERDLANGEDPREVLDRLRLDIESFRDGERLYDSDFGDRTHRSDADARDAQHADASTLTRLADELESRLNAKPAPSPAATKVAAAKTAPKPKSHMSQMSPEHRKIAREYGLPDDHPLALLAQDITTAAGNNGPDRARAMLADLAPDDVAQVGREIGLDFPAGMGPEERKDHIVKSLAAFGWSPSDSHITAPRAPAKAAPRAAKAARSVPTAAELTAMNSREEAAAALQGLTMAQLRAINPSAGRMARNKAELIDLIVNATVGHRLDAHAIKGDATLPYGPRPGAVGRSRRPDDVDDIFRADTDATTGAMVALVPSSEDARRLAVEGGLEPADLHATLLFLGDAADLSDDDRQSILNTAQSIADDIGSPVEANGFALSLFNPTGDDPCIVLGLTGEDLADTHTLASDDLEDVVDLPDQHEPWTPHITLEYADDPSKIADLLDKVGPVTFDRLRVAFADEVHDYPLNDEGEESRSASFSNTPWSEFTQADYTVEQWRDACLIHMHEGDDYTKADCKLPVREPSGTPNRNGIHAAAGRLHAVDAPTSEKTSAARTLVSLYRQMDEDPPDSLLALADMSRADLPTIDEDILRYAASSPWTKQDEDKHPRGKGPQGGQFVSKDRQQADQHTTIYTPTGPAKRTTKPPPAKTRPPAAKPAGAAHPHPTKGRRVDKYTTGNTKTKRRTTLRPGAGSGIRGGDPDVKDLQSALTALGLANLRPNGVFGDNTLTAVHEAQQRLGMRPSDHVSPSLIRKITDAAKLSNCAQRSDGAEDTVRAMSTANMPMAPTGHVAYVDSRDEPLDDVDFTDGGSVCAYADHVAVKLDNTEAVRFTPDEAREFADTVDNADDTEAHVAGASVSIDDTGDVQVRFGTQDVDLDPDEADTLAQALRDMADTAEEHEPDETGPDNETGEYAGRSTVDYYTSGDGRHEWLMSATPWSILQDRLEPEIGTLASIEMATRCVVDTYTGGDRD